MKKSEITLVVLALLAGLVIHLIKSEKIDRITEIFKPAGELADHSHVNEFIEEKKVFIDVKSLEINNPAGFITIDHTAENAITLKTIYKIYHKDKGEAEKIHQQIKVSDRKTGDTVRLKVYTDKQFPLHRVRIYMNINVPAGVKLRVVNQYGDISAQQILAGLYIRNQYGNITIDSCQGPLEIYCYRGKDVDITNVPHARIQCLHSTLNLSNIKRGIDIIKSFDSKIKIKKSNNINIQGTHTHMTLDDIKEAINLSSTHATIKLENCEGNLKIMARDCQVKLKNINCRTATIKNTYRNIDIKRISADDLSMYISHGNMDLEVAEITETLNVKGIHASITMRYPVTLTPALNLRTLYGQIMNKTSRDMEILKENQTYSLTIMEGKPEIILTTTYGDIVLKNSQ